MIVISGVNGVETGADEVWAAAGDYDIPRFLVINLLDRERTNFDEILEEAREHYGPRVFPMTLPVDAGPGFRSVLDVMRSEVITFAEDGSGKYVEKPADGALKDRVTELHRQLIDMVAESDDELLEKFFEEGTLTEEDLRAHVHAAVQKGLGGAGVRRLGCEKHRRVPDYGFHRQVRLVAGGPRHGRGENSRWRRCCGRLERRPDAWPTCSRRCTRRTSATCRFSGFTAAM